MKNTSLLCLSSPEGDSNYYSSLMNLKREGTEEPFFNVINCFQICENCLKLERVKQIQCTHIKSNAHWLSSRKIKELKTLYKASPEDAIREFGGVVVSDYLPALRKEEITRAFEAERTLTLTPPKYIFTCCDPSGGGPSLLSIASGYYNSMGDVVIIALDAEPVRNEKEEYLLLHRHYKRLLDNPVYKQSKLIFIPENNLALEANHLDAMVSDIERVQVFWEKETRPGICKTGRVTREYQFLLSNCLANNSLKLDRDLFTVTAEKTPKAMCDMLQEQMARYHWSTKKANDEHGKDRVTLTGKMGALQDDLLISVSMIVYVGRLIIRDPARLDTNA